MPFGERRIPESEIRRLRGDRGARGVIGNARVPSASQREDLERHLEYLRQRGIGEVISDMDSGLKGKRKGFLRLLDKVLHHEVNESVVVHEDRLTGFGFDAPRRAFEAHKTSTETMNQAQTKPWDRKLLKTRSQ